MSWHPFLCFHWEIASCRCKFNCVFERWRVMEVELTIQSWWVHDFLEEIYTNYIHLGFLFLSFWICEQRYCIQYWSFSAQVGELFILWTTSPFVLKTLEEKEVFIASMLAFKKIVRELEERTADRFEEHCEFGLFSIKFHFLITFVRTWKILEAFNSISARFESSKVAFNWT